VLEVLPPPGVHADLAPLAALASADQDGAARHIEIAFGKRERLADAQPSPP
jgi:hypothetical protein